MSFFNAGLSAGAPRISTLNNSASRGDVLGRKYQPFANPFFDLASTYLPPTVKGLFGFCRYFYLSHGIINAIITKAAEYPITELLISSNDSSVVKKWNFLMEGILNYRVHQFELNLDWGVYGNAFASPSLPFTKVLTCAVCNHEHKATAVRANWRYSPQGFWLSCPKCGQSDWAKARDDYQVRLADIGITRWNPELVNMFYNEATGHTDYTLDFSAEFRNGVLLGRKDIVATTPQAFLEAVRAQSSIVFDRNAVFHMRRPGMSGMGRWGVPMMMPVLKDAFFMQIMKKAQESVLLTHLVPQVFLFPQPATSGADPFSTTSLAEWRDHIRRELARQRMDPSYYGILPFPLGHQTIGENGKSLLLMPEIQAMAEHIAIGMGFPANLVFNEGSYAGSSVSMRMLENFFLSNITGHLRLVNWMMRHFGTFLNWPLPNAKFKAFKMADDVQRQALLFQAQQAGIISETTFCAHADIKLEDEAKLIESEAGIKAAAAKRKAALQAEIQGETQVIMAKYQAKAQGAANAAAARDTVARKSPFAQAFSPDYGRAGVPLDAVVAALARAVSVMPPERKAAYMSQLMTESPEMAQLVNEQQGVGLPPMPQQDPLVAQQGGQQNAQQPPSPGVDMRPMPEALPPRRDSLA